MCGLAYAHNLDGQSVNNCILDTFDNQRNRGTEGFGLFDGQEKHMVHATKEDNILKWLVKYDSNLIMFHHRNPTSTINVKRASHPFSTKDYFGDTQYILIHNGHISNSKELYPEHKKLGIKYKSLLNDGTFNDSESLLWDISLYLEGKQSSLNAYGGIAFICVKLVDKKLVKMYFGRNSNPLNLKRTKNNILLSSEGEGELIDRDTLYTYNYELDRLTHRKLTIPSWHSETSAYKAELETYKWEDYDYSFGGLTKNQGCYTYDDDYTTNDEYTTEVFALANKYIKDCYGDEESAYWTAENEYCDLMEDTEYIRTKDGIENVRLIEAVLDYLDGLTSNSYAGYVEGDKWIPQMLGN